MNKKSFLTVDFGGSNLKVAEFEITEAGGLLLCDYAIQSMGQEGSVESAREAAMQQGLQQLLAQKPWRGKNINVCAPGWHTFSKFVKLPPVDTSKVTQIIQYEAQQNVPFPLEEVVWDYQILGAAPTGELEVMLVAIKSDIVEGVFRVCESVGLRMQLVDGSPAALANAFRYNYGDLEGCTLLLDIGAKTSNLLFFDKGNVYARSINIGALSITQDFAKESRLQFPQAEQLKIEEGFVSLGGAYEEPENANQAAISKIARQVFTRLHIQVNQTVQFYRGQQGGAAPERLFLSGGASSMPYTAQFFAEKLNVPVEYFNPFRNVEIDPAVDLEELAKIAHSEGEVVGLALRNLAHCPIELNLMPKSSLSKQQFGQKKPYLVAVVTVLAMILFGGWLFFTRAAAQKQAAVEEMQTAIRPLEQQERRINNVMGEINTARESLSQFSTWLENRTYWATVLAELRDAFLQVEKEKQAEYKADMGIWIEQFLPWMPPGFLDDVPRWDLIITGTGAPEQGLLGGSPNPYDRYAAPNPYAPTPPAPAPAPAPAPNPYAGDAAASSASSSAYRDRYGIEDPYANFRGPDPYAAVRSPDSLAPGGAMQPQATGQPPMGEVAYVKLSCRGVNRSGVDPAANTKLIFAVVDALKEKTDVVDPQETRAEGSLALSEDELTFSFDVIVKLKRAIAL